MKFSDKLIEKARKLIQDHNGVTLGDPFFQKWEGKQIQHVSLEHYINGVTKYITIPQAVYEKAKNIYLVKNTRFHEKKFLPVNTKTTAVRYPDAHGNYPTGIRQQKFEGDFTREEIKSFTQEISNEKADEGRTGDMSVAVWIDEFDRPWSGKLRPYGFPVGLFDDIYDTGATEKTYHKFYVYYS